MNDNSTWKKCKVHALPTNVKLTSIPNYSIDEWEVISGDLFYNRTKYHLYITSDEEIQEGDWYVFGDKNHQILQSDGQALKITNKLGKKIIATTDPEITGRAQKEFEMNMMDKACQPYPRNGWKMKIAEPSQDFIKKFCEVGGIDEVLVNYDHYCGDSACLSNGCYEICNKISILKVSPDNTITIRKVKDSWNRDEILNLLKEAQDQIDGCGCKEADQICQWIEENL